MKYFHKFCFKNFNLQNLNLKQNIFINNFKILFF